MVRQKNGNSLSPVISNFALQNAIKKVDVFHGLPTRHTIPDRRFSQPVVLGRIRTVRFGVTDVAVDTECNLQTQIEGKKKTFRECKSSASCV
jgi:hypothetical protein